MIPRFVVADTTPVSVLSLLGQDGLDLLLLTGAELVITDVVRDELLDEPGPGSDPASGRRGEIAAWLARHVADGQIAEMPTAAGRLYRTAMAGWRAMGSPADQRPSRRDLGEASIVSLLSALTEQAGPDRTTFVIMDDRKGRAAVRALGASNVDLMGTATYLHVLAEEYDSDLAANAWIAVVAVLDGQVAPGVGSDPVLLRR